MVELVNTCIESLLSPAKLGTCHAVALYSFLYLLQHPTNLHSTFTYMSNYIIVVFQQLNMFVFFPNDVKRVLEYFERILNNSELL